MSVEEIERNKRTWDVVAPDFFAGTALPSWGVFNVEKDNPNLIGEKCAYMGYLPFDVRTWISLNPLGFVTSSYIKFV